MFNKLYEYLWVLFHPSFWCQLYDDYPYSESFDKWCRESLDNGCKFENVGIYTVKFNNKTLWIGNDELCCFYLYESSKPNVSPSRYTKGLMWKALQKQQEVVLESWK